MSIFCDNDPAINVVNGNSPGSNRHMSIRINFVPDVIAHKLVFLAHVPTSLQRARLTKVLTSSAFNVSLNQVGMRN